jgi:hypothetical protein
MTDNTATNILYIYLSILLLILSYILLVNVALPILIDIIAELVECIKPCTRYSCVKFNYKCCINDSEDIPVIIVHEPIVFSSTNIINEDIPTIIVHEPIVFSLTNIINKECAICITDNNSNSISLKCNHTYHNDCIKPWIYECTKQEKQPKCPLCNDNII